MFEPCLIFEGKEASYPTGALREALTVLHFRNRLLALPVKIGLGWKCLILANTLAYRDASLLKKKITLTLLINFMSNLGV